MRIAIYRHCVLTFESFEAIIISSLKYNGTPIADKIVTLLAYTPDRTCGSSFAVVYCEKRIKKQIYLKIIQPLKINTIPDICFVLFKHALFVRSSDMVHITSDVYRL